MDQICIESMRSYLSRIGIEQEIYNRIGWGHLHLIYNKCGITLEANLSPYENKAARSAQIKSLILQLRTSVIMDQVN